MSTPALSTHLSILLTSKMNFEVRLNYLSHIQNKIFSVWKCFKEEQLVNHDLNSGRPIMELSKKGNDYHIFHLQKYGSLMVLIKKYSMPSQSSHRMARYLLQLV